MTERFKILLLDDDETYHFIIENICDMMIADAELHWAKTTAEALDMVANNADNPFDVILVDLVLDVESGWDFIATYQSSFNQLMPKTILVVNSVDFSRFTKQKAAAYPSVSAYYVKPLNDLMIEDILTQFFDGKFLKKVGQTD